MGRQPFLHDLAVTLRSPVVCLSGRDGQLREAGTQGVLAADVRVLSSAVVTVDGAEPEPVAHGATSAAAEYAVGLLPDLGDRGPDPTVWLRRDREVVADGLRETFTLVNHSGRELAAELRLAVAADLARIESIKVGGRQATVGPTPDPEGRAPVGHGGWRHGPGGRAAGPRRAGRSRGPPALAGLGPARRRGDAWLVTVRAGSRRRRRPAAARPRPRPHRTGRRPAAGPHAPPVPRRPRRPAAGRAGQRRRVRRRRGAVVPDPLRPGLPLDGAHAAARRPPGGRRHPARARPVAGRCRRPGDGGGARQDPARTSPPDARRPQRAVPAPAAALLRHDRRDAAAGLPAARRVAVGPARRRGRGAAAGAGGGAGLDRRLRRPRRHGFAEYRADTALDAAGTGYGSLANQGWKDSPDAVRFADGRVATGPVALVEVQGYLYEAALAGAALLDAFGRPGAAAWRERAADLAARFRERFWVNGLPALALDGSKTPVDAVSSNIGHVLGTGLLSAAESERVGARLAEPDMASGFGLRTMSREAGGYAPLSYHCGSVWPHDTAVVMRGMLRAGQADRAAALGTALLAAADAVDGRLPELFGGFGADEVAEPVPYPASCRPQAWSAAAAVAVLTSALGLDVDVPDGVVTLRPPSPAPFGALSVRGLSVGRGRLDVDVDRDGRVTHVEAPPGLRVSH